MARCLLIIDIQRDYFPGGAHPLVGSDAAATVATFMVPGTQGVDIHPLVAPAAGEPVIEKSAPNGFIGTRLEAELRERELDELVVAGMMSSMCVDATVRAAVDLGFTTTVVHDACAAPDLQFDGRQLAGAAVHGAFMAALADGYASVVSAEELLSD
jgi:nicotinamidase-related amidase